MMDVVSAAWRRLSSSGSSSAPQATGSVPGAESIPPLELPTEAQTAESQRDRSKRTSVILLLGRSGSGKTFFVETALSNQGRVDNATSIQSTLQVTSRQLKIGRNKFKLIDTPGFDNPTISNLEAFAGLADYLLSESRIRIGIAGIIYIHRVGDSLESRALAQNMGVLSDIFLGDSGLSRLTIMVVPEPGTHRSISAQALSRTEVFQAAQEKGAKIVDGTLTQKKIDEVLASYISRNPALLRIQQEVLHDPHLAIGDLIEERLGYYEADSLKLRVDEQVKKRLAPHTEELRSLELALKDRESKVAELSQTCNQIKQDLNKSQEEAVYLRQQLQQSQNEHTTQLSELQEVCMEEIRLRDVALKGRESKILELSHADKKLKQQLTSGHEEMVGLRQQLQQTQNEYGSLRSQLQLQENIEQSDIVQTLKDLNRDIDDIGRLISEFLVDNYLQKAFSKEPSDVTALDARHITQLKTLLGHVDGKSSLLASSDDIGMPAEDFMDYAIRLSVCRYLYTRIFRPFHPAADATQNEVVAVLYNDIQQREPQAVAAKWRASCFKSIYRPEDPNATTHHVNSITQEFITGSLSSLLTYFLGRSANVWLEPQHQDRLTRLFRVAWDWNSMLKGDVIMLGDFHPTYYDPLRHFDPGLMDEFDSVARRPQPKFILGTLGLGLLSSRAVGGGQTPQVTVVLKATVATKNLYA